jgi:hypothetical protein
MAKFESGQNFLEINPSLVRGLPQVIWNSQEGRLEATCYSRNSTVNAIVGTLKTPERLIADFLNKPDEKGNHPAIVLMIVQYNYSTLKAMEDKTGMQSDFGLRIGCAIVDEEFYLTISLLYHQMTVVGSGAIIDTWSEEPAALYPTTRRAFKSFIREVFDAIK